MAIYSLHVSMVQRSRGQNAVQSAAYNSRSKLTLNVHDKTTGLANQFTFDYSKKGGLAYSKIYAPDGSPDWVYDREELWNKAEACEVRANSQTARKFMVALPIELNEEQNIALMEEFVSHLVEMGMVVDANIHNDKENNPHMHLMASTRKLELNRYGELVFSPVKCREWGKKAVLKFERELWGELANKHLAMHGFDARITDKSHKELGLDLVPGVHEGPARNIKNAELVELNQSIAAENARRITEKPSLIIDKLVINKPVFTKEELATELEKVLYAGIEFNEAKPGLKDSGLEITDQTVSTGDDQAKDVISDAHMDAFDERANNILAKTAAAIETQEKAAIEAFHAEMTVKYIQLYTQLLASPELSLVTEEDLKGRELYTSTKRLELEERYIETVQEMHSRQNHALGLEDADLDVLSVGEKVAHVAREMVSDIASTDIMVAFAENLKRTTGIEFKIGGAKPPLSLEQRQAVLSILNGSDIAVLEGIPGSGKTTAMGEIVRQYKKAGYKVIGVAPSSAAALQLAKATGIESKNATLWRKQWLLEGKKEFELVLRADYFKEEKYIENDSRLTNKHVMIIDEASMGELAGMDYLLSEAKKVGAKVLFVGDDNQFSAVGFAGALKKAINICGSSKLFESRRQVNPLHQQATKLLGQFKVREALEIYNKGGNIIIDENAGESRHRLVKDYIASYIETIGELKKDNLATTRSMVICTYTNAESAKLNEQVRTQLKEAGVIKGKEQSVLIGNKRLLLARGEQIVFTRNLNREGRSGIYNGEVGTVLGVSKPDNLGHANIAILVHKANGTKEGIILRTKDFNLDYGNLLDYGYAVTGYKLQGSTVDKAFVLHEKQIGYEAFNVAMTRHRDDVHLYVNKEDLHDVMYESLDIDSKKAQVHYSMIGEDEDIALSGLVKLTHKRVNNSFASDYFNMGLTAEDKHLKEYIANNVKTTKLIQKIADWQQKEFRLKGFKPDLWEHELWEEFRETKDLRDLGASHIRDNYESFKDRLIQLNMNYATILKHAQTNDIANASKQNKKSDKYLVEEQQTSFYANNKNYESLIECVEGNEGSKAKEIYTELKSEIATIYSKIQDTHGKIRDLSEYESEIKTAISIEANYREVLLPSYLRSIFRKDNNQNQQNHNVQVDAPHHGHEVLSKYEELCSEYGPERAAKMVGDKPSMLGRLEGIGIGRYFSITNKRKDAVANAGNLERQLVAYNRSMEMEQQYKQEIINEDFYSKIMRLQSEIEHLKQQLPMSLDDTFLDEVGNAIALGKTSKAGKVGSGIDLSSVRESEIFESVRTKNIQDKADFAELVVNENKLEEEKQLEQKIDHETLEGGKFKTANNIGVKVAGVTSLTNCAPNNDAHLELQMKQLTQDELSKQNKQGKVSASASASVNVDEKLEGQELPAISETGNTQSGKDLAQDVTSLEVDKDSGQVDTNISSKLQSKEARSRSKRPSLDFDEVKGALNNVHIEKLFREYAPYINADGKVEKRGNQMSCGSISINLQKGLWYRFSDASKGDIFTLISQATGASVIESFEIVAQALGIKPRDNSKDWATDLNKSQDKASNSNNADGVKASTPKDEWVAYDKVPHEAPKFNPGKDLAWLKQKGLNFVASYEYKNKEGELLGYAVRIEEIETGKKRVMPLTYAHNEVKVQSKWHFVGFSDGGDKPIYGHEKLDRDPEKLVLIVEGEKTADKAQKLLPDYTVISWMGGAQGASRVNWQELAGKEVVIWPDNDTPGQEAASIILSAINKINGFSGICSIVDTKTLNLPEKWDLADEIPRGLDPALVIEDCKGGARTIEDWGKKCIEFNLKGLERNIFWQKASIGVLNSKSSINEEAALTKYVEEGLKTSGIVNYMNYQVAKGRVDHPHEFLTLHDGLLQEMVAASVADYIGHNARQEEAKELYEAIGSGSKDDAPLDGLAKKLLEIHKQASQAANVSLIKTSKQYSLDQQQLKEQNPDKAKLHEQLMRDFGILHEHQTRMPLSHLHTEVLSKDLAKIIKEYDLTYKGSTRVLDNNDSTSIAQTAHAQINHPNWWKKITENQVERKESYLQCVAKGKEEIRLKNEEERVLRLKDVERFKENNVKLLKEIEFWGGGNEHDKLLESLTGIDQRKKLGHVMDLRDNLIKRSIKINLETFDDEKRRIYSLAELEPIARKEQEFLVDLCEKTRNGITPYHTDIREYLYKGNDVKASPEKIDLVFKEASEMVKNGIEKEFRLVRNLDGAIGAKSMLDYLDHVKEGHARYVKEPMSRETRIGARNVDDALKAIGDEQEFLASWYGQLKYCDPNKGFQERVSAAYENEKTGVMNCLREVTRKHLINGISNNDDLTKQLQNTDNIKVTHDKLAKELEAYEFKQNIDRFNQKIGQTKTIPEVLKAIDQKQEYLACLRHDNNAKNDNPNLLKQEFKDAVDHVIKYEVMPEEQLLKHLKTFDTGSIKPITEELTKVCENHHKKIVEKNLNQLVKTGKEAEGESGYNSKERSKERNSIEVGGHKFDCPLKYIEHEINHPAHIYVNQKAMKQLQQQVVQFQMQKQKQMELVHEIGGPRF